MFQKSGIRVCLGKFTKRTNVHTKTLSTPGPIYDHIDLDVHLDPQDGLKRLQNRKIRIPLEKLGY